MCDPPRIYPSLPKYTPLFNKFICATLPQSTPPSQSIPPLSANLYVRPSQNLPLPPKIYPSFQQIYMCDPPTIYPSLPEYTPLISQFKCATLPESTHLSQNTPPFSTNIYVRPSHNLPLPPIIYPPYQPIYMSHPRLRIYPSSPFYNYMRYSKNTPQSLNMPPFLKTTCNCERIYHSLPKLKNILVERGGFLEGRIII